jgi:hypothetical protein
MTHEAGIWDTVSNAYRCTIKVQGLLGPPSQLALSAMGRYLAYGNLESGGKTGSVTVLKMEPKN